MAPAGAWQIKPNLLRYTNSMADKACHAVGSVTKAGFILALDIMGRVHATGANSHRSSGSLRVR